MLICFITFSLLFFFVEGSCPDGSLEYNSNCYIFNATESGFSKAELSCIQIGGHLASIHDMFTNNLLGQEAPAKFQQSTETIFWIGAEKLQQNGSWTWTDGTPFDFADWNKGEPQNITGSNCAALSLTDGYWSTQDCFKTKPFVCEVAKDISPTYPTIYNCSDGWTYFYQTHSCYGLNDAYPPLFNWTTGENYCENMGAHLVSVHSFEEFQFIMSYIYVGSYNIWTGVFSIDSQKTWKSSDGSPVDIFKYGKWCKNHPQNITGESCMGYGNDPNQDCYGDLDCSTMYRIICKKPI